MHCSIESNQIKLIQNESNKSAVHNQLLTNLVHNLFLVKCLLCAILEERHFFFIKLEIPRNKGILRKRIEERKKNKHIK